MSTDPDAVGRPLPAEVRQRLIVIAADFMGKTAIAELPAGVRRFARFAPAKRARLGGADIATALAVDEGFRQAVAETVVAAAPELAAQVQASTPPAAADPVDVAVLAYLTRPQNWTELVAAAADQVAERRDRQSADADQARLQATVARLTETTEAANRERDAARAAVKAAAAEQAARTAESQAQLRRLQAELRTAQRAADQLARELAELRAEVVQAGDAAAAELRRARSRIAALEAESGADRRGARKEREHDDARLWVLLETITAAATGLRRELDVSNPSIRPADSVSGELPADGTARPFNADAGLLDRLLDGAHVHLIVDGYNLTKTGYPTLPLADQRSRLITSLGALTARTGVEVTVAFDGTTAPTGAAASVATPRRVRVLFSAPGQLADDLIRDLLRAEPAGRSVIVATSDQAVAASARAAGAWTATAATMLSRLVRT